MVVQLTRQKHFPYIICHIPFVIRGFKFEVQQRAEGPTVNSHAREGVVIRRKKKRAPKVRQWLITGKRLPVLRTWDTLFANSHALTGVAIDCRPFGPVRCTSNLNPRFLIFHCNKVRRKPSLVTKHYGAAWVTKWKM